MKYDFDKPVDRHNTMSVKWDSCLTADELPLWVADMDFETAPAITDAIVERARHGVFGYVHPSLSYYRAIADWFSRRHGWHIDASSVIYTIGVVPAVSACVKALARPGEGVIVQTPVYTCFFSSIRNNGCEVVENPLRRVGDRFEMDFEDLERKCADPHNTLLILCNPHNPAGRVWSADELRRLDAICARNGVTVVSDEIHCEIVMPGFRYTPFATVATAASVSCISPSKAFNTAGLQTANIVAPDKRMYAAIDRAININEVCDVGVFGPVALIAAYNHGEEWLEEMIHYVHGNYEYCRDYVAGHIPGVRVMPLEGTYLAWVDVSALGVPVAELCERLRSEAHVWFHPGTVYGADGEGYLRINLATRRAVVEEALRRFADFVSGLC